MNSLDSRVSLKRFFDGLKERGLSNEDIEALAKRSGERHLTDKDLLILKEVKSQLVGKEEKNGSEA